MDAETVDEEAATKALRALDDLKLRAGSMDDVGLHAVLPTDTLARLLAFLEPCTLMQRLHVSRQFRDAAWTALHQERTAREAAERQVAVLQERIAELETLSARFKSE